MRFLLTNDDGIDSPGLLALAHQMSALGEVFVVGPEREWSGGGHAITIHKPLRVRPQKSWGDRIQVWEASGGPADCVVLGVFDLLPQAPDMVISGINLGPNLGEDLTYSGTVSAALEAFLCDLPGFSISINSFTDPRWETAAEVVAKLIGTLTLAPSRFLLNINVPNLPLGEIAGIQLTRLGRRRYRERLTKGLDPFGRPYYWIAGFAEDGPHEEGTDVDALEKGYVSITPFHLDLTDYTMLSTLEPMRRQLWEELAGQ